MSYVISELVKECSYMELKLLRHQQIPLASLLFLEYLISVLKEMTALRLPADLELRFGLRLNLTLD